MFEYYWEFIRRSQHTQHMAETQTEERIHESDLAACYWVKQFVQLGMLIGHAETLAWGHGVDRHAVREALETGAQPGLVFQVFAPL